MTRLRFLLRQHLHDADRSLYFRPALILGALAAAGVALPFAEERMAGLRAMGKRLGWAVPMEPGAVQVVLATIAGSVMTVVSIVYSVLIVALSLASMQFSPRILTGYMRDRTSQRILGLFIGTFTYCLLVLRATHGEPERFVPAISVFGALLLVLACLSSLLFFVHHMAKAIQANYIVDRIATETEAIIDDVLPPRATPAPALPPQPPESPGHVVRATASGYVQILAVDDLAGIARARGVTLHVLRAMGHFVPEGSVLVVADRPLDDEACSACRDAFDLGAVRTMQDDIEFGIRQIVDMALKAISPAVNDPSTAVTCIDHLSRLLGRMARRGDPESVRCDAVTGEPLVVLPPSGFTQSLDLGMNQLRQYGKGDIAVLLRLTRALWDVADMTERPSHRTALALHAAKLRSASAPLPPDDREELDRRLDALSARLAGGAM